MTARKASAADQIVFSAWVEGIELALAGSGVITGGIPSQRAAGANMSIDVSACTWVISGVQYTTAGVTNVAVTAAPTTATYVRQDLVYANAAGISIATGVEGAAPSDASYPDPLALPTGAIPIALIEVGNSVTTITDARIVDIRSITHHLTTGDPHTQYTTTAEATTLVTDHAAAADPHTGYQKESEKSQANGYASLSATTKVPIAELPTGTTSTTVSLGDHTTPAATVSAGGHMEANDKKQLTRQSLGTLTGATAIDLSLGTAVEFTLGASLALTISTLPPAGSAVVFQAKQDGTGSRLVTSWPAQVLWSGGTAPTLTTTANKVDVFSGYCDGTNIRMGTFGLNYA